jgi:hypothetical protein
MLMTVSSTGFAPPAGFEAGAEIYGCYVDASRAETHLSLFPFILGMETVCGRPMVSPGPVLTAGAIRAWPPIAPCCPTCRSELHVRRYRHY